MTRNEFRCLKILKAGQQPKPEIVSERLCREAYVEIEDGGEIRLTLKGVEEAKHL